VRSALSLVLTGSLLLVSLPTAALAVAGDAIVFLHLRWADGQVSLVDATVRPGRLKASTESHEGSRLKVQLTDADGKALWQGSVVNPAVQRIEVPPPAAGGSPTWVQTRPKTVDVVLRAPALSAARELRITQPPGARGAAQAAGAAQPPELVTRIPLPKLSDPATR
jgi:hypothetical protein